MTLDAPALLQRLRAAFATGASRPLPERKRRLRRLQSLLHEQEGVLADALAADLGKSSFESWTSEINHVAAEIDHVLAHLDDWAEPQTVPTPALYQPARSWIVHEPLGVCLVIAPWNYPVHLTLSPLVAALSAGNVVALKPSELAPATSAALQRLIPQYFGPDEVVVVPGGVAETTALLEQKWDHVFFTGSERVGTIVLAATSRHLTPTVLELGGKSPTIVDETAPLGVTARRIAWGRFWNAGQTCVAPDYVLVHRSRQQALIDALAQRLRESFGDDPSSSDDYGRIAHHGHFDRLVGLLDGGRVVHGGQHDRESRFFAPTLLTDVDPDAPVMTEEIFGPILPVLPYDSLDEAIAFVNARPKPLALYVFTTHAATRDAVLARTSSGSVGVNQTMMQLGNPDLPFGGVGASGMGRYHARDGFVTYSNRRSVMERSARLDLVPLYPPYPEWKRKMSKAFL